MKKSYRNYDLWRHPRYYDMAGYKPHDAFESNGASCAPDVVFGVNVRTAAHWHDYAYSGECPGTHTEQDRYWADQDFLANLRTCGLGAIVARIYYFRVRLWGHWAYRYDDGAEPKRTPLFWLRLFFGRYFEC